MASAIPAESESSESSVAGGGSSDNDLSAFAGLSLGVKPYMFEPLASSSDSDTSNDNNEEPNADRIGKSDWCTCGQCMVREDAATSFCCRECPQLDAIRKEVDGVECCTENEGVRTVTTNSYVLRVAYNSNRTKYGQRRGRKGPWTENEKYRHVAYGNIVALAWGWLGRRNRVPLPSCVMKMITTAFPSDQYTGFKLADKVESD